MPVQRQPGGPVVYVREGGQVVALVVVASVGQHQVLDGVVRPTGPGREVIDLGADGDPAPAIKAGMVLEFQQAAPECFGKRDSFRAGNDGLIWPRVGVLRRSELAPP